MNMSTHRRLSHPLLILSFPNVKIYKKDVLVIIREGRKLLLKWCESVVYGETTGLETNQLIYHNLINTDSIERSAYSIVVD